MSRRPKLGLSQNEHTRLAGQSAQDVRSFIRLADEAAQKSKALCSKALGDLLEAHVRYGVFDAHAKSAGADAIPQSERETLRDALISAGGRFERACEFKRRK